MQTLLLTAKDVLDLINMADVIRAVERAFIDYSNGLAAMPPKAYVSVPNGDFRAMPAALPDAAGVKWVNVHPGNPALGLPTVMGVMVYNDTATGYPLAVIDGTQLTAYRTGAASAIASKYLARKGSQTLGLIGAGRQAHTQLMAHLELFSLREVRVYDLSTEAIARLVRAFPKIAVSPAPLEAAAACDIVCTVTPAHNPVLARRHVRPGTHINAVGADAPGKEELEPSILNVATVVVDDLVQATKAGEINVPVSRGLYRPEQVYGILGDIITGKKKLERQPDMVTVFDSTGIAIEDVATAKMIVGKANMSPGGYQSIDLVGV
ncbi:MAG: ornithine cyclodeaminase family protein [Chloroflexi bacterium]|nr:ornithine cyclodeaminase family protein [Chloroflexota bacterium]